MKTKSVMKKKTIGVALIAFIVVNVSFTTSPDLENQSQLSLMVLEARADGETGETDIPDPGDEIIPLRQFPKDWSLSAVVDYIFE